MPELPTLPTRLPLEALPVADQDRLRLVASRAGGRAWLVGGPVRDALLGWPILDFDLVLEADAAAVAAALPARLTKTTAFGTATVAWPDGTVWDLATARAESYPEPGALPVCRPATLADDLARRDFTINAVAASLAPSRWGELTDPYAGRDDLARRRIRTLHEGSFRDDPTRLFRAARYAARLGFTLEPGTVEQAAAAVGSGMLGTLTPARVLHELERSLGEHPGVTQITALGELAVWDALVPGLELNRPRLARLDRSLSGSAVPFAWAARIAALLPHENSPQVAARLTHRLQPSRLASEVWELTAARLAAGPWPADARPSQVAAVLDRMPDAALLALAAHWPALRQGVQSYRGQWRQVRPALNGHELQELGVAPGPGLGAVLARLRQARLDGEVTDREGEVAVVRQWLEGRHDG